MSGRFLLQCCWKHFTLPSCLWALGTIPSWHCGSHRCSCHHICSNWRCCLHSSPCHFMHTMGSHVCWLTIVVAQYSNSFLSRVKVRVMTIHFFYHNSIDILSSIDKLLSINRFCRFTFPSVFVVYTTVTVMITGKTSLYARLHCWGCLYVCFTRHIVKSVIGLCSV